MEIYIQNLFNNCFKIQNNHEIYYYFSENITRQLKYNKLLKNKKDIKVNYNDIIFNLDFSESTLYIDYEKVKLYLKTEYDYNNFGLEFKNNVNKILCNILNIVQLKKSIDIDNLDKWICCGF